MLPLQAIITACGLTMPDYQYPYAASQGTILETKENPKRVCFSSEPA
jgi:hypothetical protein